MTIALAGPPPWVCGPPSQHPPGAGPLCDARLPTSGLLRLPGARFCSLNPLWFLVSTAMLLLCGALVSGPYALITTAVSADLVSGGRLSTQPGDRRAGAGRGGTSSIHDSNGLY